MSHKFTRKGHHSVKDYEEEWLDNQETLKRTARKPQKKIPDPGWLKSSETNAHVIEVLPKLCNVKMDEDGSQVLCNYRRSLVFKPGSRASDPSARDRSPVAVGDRVKVNRMSDQEGVIEGVAKRESYFVRVAPGRNHDLYHTLAANIDVVAIISAVNDPPFSPHLIDRFLVSAQIGNVKPLLVVNKSDLWDGNNAPWKFYENELQVPTVTVCAVTGAGLSDVLAQISGKRVVFVGHSGVGKTTLIGRLLEREVGKTASVNDFTGKGKHTTTSALLFSHANGSQWIDTPGVRSFSPPVEDIDTIREFYPEFSKIPCEQSGCFHLDEPGCKARELWRYESYLQLFRGFRSG